MGPVLEINLISAQDLAHISRNMKTYAIAWINTDPMRKFTTRVDQNNQTNPIWNEKFVFRINDKILDVDASAIVIEIYAAAWSKDALIGTVNVNLTDVFTPWSGFYDGAGDDGGCGGGGMRLVTLQIRRPSGRLQGFFKLGVAFIDGGQRSMPLSIEVFDGSQRRGERGSNSDITDLTTDVKTEVVVTNGGRFSGVGGTESMVNESICNSDIGPSASVVAAAIAQGLYNRQKTAVKAVGVGNKEDASSILERWRTVKKGAVVATKTDRSGDRKQRRRNGGGGGGGESKKGLFSCFGNVLGCEISITCGGESGGEGESTKKRYNNKNNKVVNLSDVDETFTHSTS